MVERNIKTYARYALVSEALILGPIMTLYLIAKGLSFTEIMLVNSVSSVAVVCFEVPTGAIADQIGRKFSLIAGALLVALSLGVYVLANSLAECMIAEVIFALGWSFKSGSDTALIYDSLKIAGREQEFQGIEGRARARVYWVQAFGSLIAGFVYEWNIHLPMLISLGFMLLTATICLGFKEVDVHEEHHKGIAFRQQVFDSGKYIWQHRKVRSLILYTMGYYIFFRAAYFLYQPYMKAVNIRVAYFGAIFFAFNVVAAYASRHSAELMTYLKKRTLMTLSLLIIVSFALLGMVRAPWGVAAILLQQVARGMFRPVTRKYLNKHIPSNKRATILSFNSLLTNLAGAAFYPLVGLLMDRTGVFTSHYILSLAMLIVTVLTLSYYGYCRKPQPVLDGVEL